MPIAFNDLVVECQFRYTFNNEPMMNTVWVEAVDPAIVNSPTLETLGETLLLWYETFLIPLQHPTCQLREIFLRQAVADPAQVHTQPGDATDVGTALGEALPGNVSLTVSFRTGLSGRSFRGRNYSLGMTEGQQTGGVVSTAYFNALTAAYQELDAALSNIGDFRHIVYSQISNGSPRPSGVTTPVTAIVIVDANTDSQRRRNRGVGS